MAMIIITTVPTTDVTQIKEKGNATTSSPPVPVNIPLNQETLRDSAATRLHPRVGRTVQKQKTFAQNLQATSALTSPAGCRVTEEEVRRTSNKLIRPTEESSIGRKGVALPPRAREFSQQ